MQDNSVGCELSRVIAPKVMIAAHRQVFTVELRPEETTYVSWRKLVKDANRAHGSSAAVVAATASVVAPVTAPESPPNAQLNPQARIAPAKTAEEGSEDEPAPNRFSSVIEKIERLYMGKDSSDEAELDETPDDDQYDTEDSFIDDAELDEYFEVDNSAIKHDGFFVNRGKLERANEPPVRPTQQPKKRRRKDAAKPPSESDYGHVSNKHVKAGKMVAGRTEPSLNVKDIENSKMGFPQSKIVVSNKLKDASGSSDFLQSNYHDKSASTQSKSQHGKLSSNFDRPEQSVRVLQRVNNSTLPDINVSDGIHAMHTAKSSHVLKKDGSTFRPKSSGLEKAIRELEKMVAESRPPTVEYQEADTSSQGIKRRLPREIKLKLAKVARLAASQGKVSEELLNRLMSILGHLIQLRTLKRNLKTMINMGLSPTAKQEKDARFLQIKKEVIEMIKTRIPSFEAKILEPQPGASDGFQEIGSEERVVRRKFSMDASLENKICELYDLYADGLDEDAGPQIRKLYVELAQLWPNGMMDNHEIKLAICRAKERRRARYNRRKDQEEIKRKKMSIPGSEESDSASNSQSEHIRERLATGSGGQSLLLTSKSTSNTTAAVRVLSPPTNDSSFDRLKQDKLKGISSRAGDDEIKIADASLPKKKVKRKPEMELDESHFRPEKLHLQQGSNDRIQSIKQPMNLPTKSKLPATAATFDHPS